jgi:hypothetical protein
MGMVVAAEQFGDILHRVVAFATFAGFQWGSPTRGDIELLRQDELRVFTLL